MTDSFSRVEPGAVQPLTTSEALSLRRLRFGEEVAQVPPSHIARFMVLAWIEHKYGGYVLTALGRYQLEVRARDRNLRMLARRCRRRAVQLHAVIANTTDAEAAVLRDIVRRWEALALQAEELALLEDREPLLA